MDYLICYDISQNNLRNRFVKLLFRFGCKRVQKSVFLGTDFEKKQLSRLLKITEVILKDTPNPDCVLFVPIGADFIRQVELVGSADSWIKAVEGLDDLYI